MINFPTSPALNDVHTEGGNTWIFNGTAWRLRDRVTSTITETDTTRAPSSAAVFEALALKADDVDVVHTTGAETVAGAKTFTDNMTLGDGTTSKALIIDGVAGGTAEISLRTGGLSRWLLRRNATAESGGNAGSDLQLFRFTDAGAATSILTVTRSTMVFTFGQTPTVNGDTMWHAGNDGPGSGLNADQLEGLHGNAGVVGSTVATRDANADLHARLFRPSFGNQSTMSGALAFRIDSGGDNYIRFCDAPSAVRTWMQTFSGTYTPTLTNVANIDASTAFGTMYTRVGDVVTVSGRLNIDPTALGLVQLRLSVPVASNFTTTTQLSGVGSSLNESARILADAATDTALLEYTATSTANTGITFTFQYLII